MQTARKISLIEDFLKLESAGGILLMAATFFAMILANSPLSHYYHELIEMDVTVSVGEYSLSKHLLHWINDGLMTTFFLLVGLELKREIIEGQLSKIKNVMLPAIGAVGGMIVPAVIYYFFNSTDGEVMKGWAIPVATDIAFALGILSLLGSRVPVSLKIFLASLAIFDDIGAIVIIAVFYTANISFFSLTIAAVCLVVLYILNRSRIGERSPYLVVGFILWLAMSHSGVHATLAGVLLAMFVPLRLKKRGGDSPLKELEHDLHRVVAFFILPAFAFVNSGIYLHGATAEYVLHNVSVGVGVGLFIGKQIGVFLFCWIGLKLNIARLPRSISYGSLYGVSILCGIGFTMSLFIGTLAFHGPGASYSFDERIGIIVGSALSAIVGLAILHKSLPSLEELRQTAEAEGQK
jgi:NhaA family Na+:H+ antiporter